jgi:hypothetical protein
LQDGEVAFFAIFFPIFLDRSSIEQMKKIDTAQSANCEMRKWQNCHRKKKRVFK